MVDSRKIHRVLKTARQDGTGSTSGGGTSDTSSSTTSSSSSSSTSQSSTTTPPDTPTSSSTTSSQSTSDSPPPSSSTTTTSTSVPPDTTSTSSTHTTPSPTPSSTPESTSTPPPETQQTTSPPPPPPSETSLPPTSTSSITTVTSTLSSGETTVFTSALPTSLSSSPPSKSARNRTAIIAGATTAGIVLLLIALGAVFLYRRHQIRQQFDAYFHRPKRENRGLLDGEEFDDDDGDLVPMQRYRDASGSTTSEVPRSTTPNSQAPSLYRARALDTGSIFREEVWPPPGEGSELVDPFEKSVRRSREVDLGSIVDDVMGPQVVEAAPQTGHKPKSENVSTASSSDTAYTGLPVTQDRPESSQSAYQDPFRSASQAAAPTSSVYYTLPPGASPASTPGAPVEVATKSPPSSQQLQPPLVTIVKPISPRLEPGASTKPKASSPLARVMSSASSKISVGAAESKNWLDKKVRGSVERSRT